VPLFSISNPENPGRQLSCKGSGFNGSAGGRVPSHFALGRSPNTCQPPRLAVSRSDKTIHRQTKRHVQCSSPEPDPADNKSTAHQQRPPNGADDRRLTGRSAGTQHSRGRLTATADSPNGTRCTMEVEHLIGPLLGDNIRRPNDTNEQKRGESQSSFGHKSNRSAQRTRVRINALKEKYLAAKEIRRRQPRKKLCAKSGVNQHRKEM
jgi:hypothetical protein